MTVNTTSIVSGPYAGNNIADTFSYGFKIEDKTQLAVYETDDVGVETLLTVDVDYTVASIGNDAGGTVTRVAGALPTNYQWLIRSDYKYTQLTAFQSQGAFFPDLHENAMDKLTFLNQQILDKLGRGPVVSDTYTGTLPLSLPDPTSELFLRWKSDLTGFENFDINSIGALAVSDFAKTYLDELTASDTRAVLETKESFTDLDQTPSSLTGSAYKVPSVNSAENAILFLTALSTDNYAHFRDEKTNGKAAGSSVAGVNIRVINTTVVNNITGCSLASNQVTLAAGTYYIKGKAPLNFAGRAKTYLYDTTNTADLVIGDNTFDNGSTAGTSWSHFEGIITLAGSTVVEVRSYAELANASFGLGVEVSSGQVEVYTGIEIWRLA